MAAYPRKHDRPCPNDFHHHNIDQAIKNLVADVSPIYKFFGTYIEAVRSSTIHSQNNVAAEGLAQGLLRGPTGGLNGVSESQDKGCLIHVTGL